MRTGRRKSVDWPVFWAFAGLLGVYLAITVGALAASWYQMSPFDRWVMSVLVVVVPVYAMVSGRRGR